MKKTRFFAFFKPLLLTALSALSLTARAQQNLFNIPSGDITPAGKVFFQQQINVMSHQEFASKSHFVYGLKHNSEIGLNVVNKYFDFGPRGSRLRINDGNTHTIGGALYPVLLATAQKGFYLNKDWLVSGGLQAGFNLSNSLAGKRFTWYSYLLSSYNIAGKVKLVGGVYQSENRLLGPGNTSGYMAGLEAHLSKRIWLMADHISGSNKNSVSVIGATVNVKQGFQLCAGWQIPNRLTAENPALVLELNLFNF